VYSHEPLFSVFLRFRYYFSFLSKLKLLPNLPWELTDFRRVESGYEKILCGLHDYPLPCAISDCWEAKGFITIGSWLGTSLNVSKSVVSACISLPPWVFPQRTFRSSIYLITHTKSLHIINYYFTKTNKFMFKQELKIIASASINVFVSISKGRCTSINAAEIPLLA